MLNAVALNAVLDVDEFLFAGMTPIRIQHAIQNQKPMRVKYGRRRSQCESSMHFAALLALVLTCYFVLPGPLSEIMLAVKTEMCGGIQTFVVAYNSDTQITIGLATNPSRDSGELSVIESAVQTHKDLGKSIQPLPSSRKWVVCAQAVPRIL